MRVQLACIASLLFVLGVPGDAAAIDVVDIRLRDLTADTVVSSAVMTTDDSLVLGVEVVLSSDSGTWVSDVAEWSVSTDNVAYDGPTPPSSALRWALLPVTAGSARVCVTNGSQSACVDVDVSRAPPSRVRMTVLEPDSLIRAGAPIHIQVTVENADGPVPGMYCFDGDSTGRAGFAESLVPDTARPVSTVRAGDTSCALGWPGSEAVDSLDVCFVDGVDTIAAYLYDAPWPSPPRRLFARFGPLTAETDTFRLLPGTVHALALTADDSGTVDIPDTVFIDTDGYQVFFAQGFDRYGNPRGPERCVWTLSDTLPTPTVATQTRIWLDGTEADSYVEGLLTATVIGDTVRASAYVIIMGAQPVLMRATTRDTNSNGAIDAVELWFSGVVDLSEVAPATFYNALHVQYGAAGWAETSVAGLDGSLVDSMFVVGLAETLLGRPQSGLRPTVRVDSLLGVMEASPVRACHDGVGPVVWGVRVYAARDSAQDEVEVVFSERVEGVGGALDLDTPPGDFLTVFVHTGDSALERSRATLPGIEGLLMVEDSVHDGARLTRVRFAMTNGLHIGTEHRLGIRVDPSPALRDLAEPMANDASLANQPAAVVVSASQGGTVVNEPSSDDTGCGDCGTGTEALLVPVLLVRGRRLLRRRRRRR